MVTPEYGYTYADLIVKCGMGGRGRVCRYLIPGRVKYWKIKELKSETQGAGFRLLGLNPSFITCQLIFSSVCFFICKIEIPVYTLCYC